eukprot:366444-Chlamydomonas_euryale.AAC.19
MVGVYLAESGRTVEHDEDDRRSTSTVASTAGTGVFSLASRMAALAVDFSDKLDGAAGEVEGSILEEVAEAEGSGDEAVTRSERSITTAPVSVVGEEPDAEEEPVDSQLISRGAAHNTDSPFAAHRLPLQVNASPRSSIS